MAIQKYKGHLALLGAAIMWGLMSPIGKTALENGISGLSLATFRMTGGAVCFWIASIFAPKEQVKPHDLMMLFFAGLLGHHTLVHQDHSECHPASRKPKHCRSGPAKE